MRKTLATLLALVLAACLCGTALAASEGDRTIISVKENAAMADFYIENVLVTDEGICVFMTGNDQMIRLYRQAGAEPEEYMLQQDYVPYTLLEESTGPTRQNLAWFAYKGGLYVLQYESKAPEEGDGPSEIDGGYVMKVTLKDGEIRYEDSGIPKLDWTNMVEDYGDWQGNRGIMRLVAAGDSLVASTWDNDGNNLMEVFDLQTGYNKEVYLANMDDMYAGPEGTVLVKQVDWRSGDAVTHFLKIDPATGDEEEICRFPLTSGTDMMALTVDEKTGTYYYIMNGEILADTAMPLNPEEAEAVNDCPVSYGARSLWTEDGMLLVWSNTSVMVRNTDPAARKEGFRLVIEDMVYSGAMSDAIIDFANVRQEATVVLRRNGNPQNILQNMMNQDAETDIYTLNYDSNVFDALRTRGYLADLGDNADLAAAAGRMYPFMQDALEKDGKLIAVPLDLYGYTIGLRPEAWKKSGLDEAELPRTWGEFFDWLETLPAKMAEKGISVFDPWMSRSDLRSGLMSMMMQQYQQWIGETGRDVAFNTPVLRGLLERMDRLDYDALGLRENPEEGENGGFIDYDQEYKEPLIDMMSAVRMETWGNDSKILALALEEGGQAVLPLEASIAFVNPYSRNAEAAKEFLACALNNVRPEIAYSVFADRTEPVPDPYAERSRRMLESWLEEAKVMMEKAQDEDERAEWQERIKTYEEDIRRTIEESWMISAAAVASYQQRADLIRLEGFGFGNSLYASGDSDNFYEVVNGYTLGTVAPEELLSLIDRKIQMMILEGN